MNTLFLTANIFVYASALIFWIAIWVVLREENKEKEAKQANEALINNFKPVNFGKLHRTKKKDIEQMGILELEKFMREEWAEVNNLRGSIIKQFNYLTQHDDRNAQKEIIRALKVYLNNEQNIAKAMTRFHLLRNNAPKQQSY